jgi:hypothetical protein
VGVAYEIGPPACVDSHETDALARAVAVGTSVACTTVVVPVVLTGGDGEGATDGEQAAARHAATSVATDGILAPPFCISQRRAM